MRVPYGTPSLVASLVSLAPCGGRWCQVEAGDTLATIGRDVIEAATPGAAHAAGVARYEDILRACTRWNTRLYGDDLERAVEPKNADGVAAISAERWPASNGPHYGLLWCPEIVAWELADASLPLPLINDAEPPGLVIDYLRGPL
jgi:hypothetical protein